MPRDALKQRIQYLVEHGGTYPEERRRPDWKSWATLGLLVFLAATELLEILKLLP